MYIHCTYDGHRLYELSPVTHPNRLTLKDKVFGYRRALE